MIQQRYILLFFFALGTYSTYAAINCLDNSWHLTKKYDDKEYHLVACNCPCSQYRHIEQRNQCLKCLHYHDIIPLYIIRREEWYKSIKKDKTIYPTQQCYTLRYPRTR